MKTKLSALLLSVSISFPTAVCAQSRGAIDRTTDVAALLPASAGVALSLVNKDYKGLGQLALSGAATLAVNYGLEATIRKQRPDGTGHHAFPSTHTAVSFAGATYLMKRYGWQWGVPAYAVSAYVGWGRVFAKKHDVWDVAAGAAIGAACAYVLTRPRLGGTELTLAPTTLDAGRGMGIYAKVVF